MFLYRIGPEGFYAAAEEPGGTLRVLYSDPFETRPGGWELGREVDPGSAAPARAGRCRARSWASAATTASTPASSTTPCPRSR